MKVLLLAGTTEARHLADLLAASEYEAEASLAGVTTSPAVLPIQTRSAGFGGESAQERFLAKGAFGAVIDASHPFAQKISTRSHRLAQRLSIPYIRLIRHEWREQTGDIWHSVPMARDTLRLVPKGARVFLATGARSIGDWAELSEDRTLFCRRVDATDQPFPFDGDWIIGRPPFALEDEISLLRTLEIDWVVAKNAGGPTRAKLDAARHLGVPVAMLERPARLGCDHAETAEEALAWLDTLNG